MAGVQKGFFTNFVKVHEQMTTVLDASIAPGNGFRAVYIIFRRICIYTRYSFYALPADELI